MERHASQRERRNEASSEIVRASEAAYLILTELKMSPNFVRKAEACEDSARGDLPRKINVPKPTRGDRPKRSSWNRAPSVGGAPYGKCADNVA